MPPRSAPLPGPAPVTKNVMLGACGNWGGGAGCCWARAPDVIPSASAAMIIAFDLLISVLPRVIDALVESPAVAPSCIGRRSHPSYSVNGEGCNTLKARQL